MRVVRRIYNRSRQCINMKLRWYQEEAVESVFYYFEHNEGNPIIALPTGTGKSLVIAEFIRRGLNIYPETRILMLTHVDELLKQNVATLKKIWPAAPVGIFSAALKQRDVFLPIIFGGVASVVRAIQQFGWRDLIIIDECHLLSPAAASMYQKIISALKEINPYLKVIGFSATPFRMKDGILTDGGLFTDICYNQCTVGGFNQLVTEGYIAPLIPACTESYLDVSDVSTSSGDFNQKQLQNAVNKREITERILEEVCRRGAERNCWLIFGSGIEHVENIKEILTNWGIKSACAHSKQDNEKNTDIISSFKNGKLRALINYGKLTTGFDHPPVDLIAMMRCTMSAGLWVQMLGRGTRPSPGKENCLVLDFAKNTERLGPINDPFLPQKRTAGQGDAPVKICDACCTYNHTSARVCIFCGTEFTLKVKINIVPGSKELIKSDLPVHEWFDVDTVIYTKHERGGKSVKLKVTYFCESVRFYSWFDFECGGFPSKKARDWWRRAVCGDPPQTTEEAIVGTKYAKKPTSIKVHINSRYKEVINYKYE